MANRELFRYVIMFLLVSFLLLLWTSDIFHFRRALIPVTILQLTEEEVGVDIEDLRKWRRKPNIVLLLTDDQAAVDDSMYKMPTVRDHLLKSGVRFSHAFASTPICCPSRSSILTGLYQHNHRVFNNSLEGGCSSRDWQLNHEANALPVLMKKAGYNTFYAGKYLNQYGDRSVGGESHVPAGWDQWFGLLGNSRYYNYSLSANGVREQHGDQPEDYLTTVIGKKALSFLDAFGTRSSDRSYPRPFFMVLSPPAPHAPFTPEQKYSTEFSELKAPRPPSFNVRVPPTPTNGSSFTREAKHWLLRMTPSPLSQETIETVDEVYRNRLRTLLSVDDLLRDVMTKLKRLSSEKGNLMQDTIFLVTSDHGFHLGEFSLPWDKRQPYEFDIRIPMVIAGPGIKQGVTVQAPVLTIDLAPTILDLASADPSEWFDSMDGDSFLPLAMEVSSLINAEQMKWRDGFLIEYYGEGSHQHSTGGNVSAECSERMMDPGLSNCNPSVQCKCQDASNNTFLCLRAMANDGQEWGSFKYCEFEDSEDFIESYDLDVDPFELDNQAIKGEADDFYISDERRQLLSSSLHKLSQCRRSSCRSHHFGDTSPY